MEYESAADARRNDATERHESRLAELADETSAELSRVAAQFERAMDARRDDAERHEVKLAELADATRAELSRIAARFERVATDRIAQVEELTARAAAQAQEISECMAGLDRREAEFTRRVEEGLEHLDSRFAAWRDELTQLRRAHDASLESAIKRLTELINRVDRDHGSFGNATAQRVQELENALAEQSQAVERLRTADCERAAAQRHDALAPPASGAIVRDPLDGHQVSDPSPVGTITEVCCAQRRGWFSRSRAGSEKRTLRPGAL